MLARIRTVENHMQTLWSNILQLPYWSRCSTTHLKGPVALAWLPWSQCETALILSLFLSLSFRVISFSATMGAQHGIHSTTGLSFPPAATFTISLELAHCLYSQCSSHYSPGEWSIPHSNWEIATKAPELSTCAAVGLLPLILWEDLPHETCGSGGFLNPLGDFPDGMTDDPLKAITSLWYQETRRALDPVDPEHLTPVYRNRKASWFTQEIWSVKQCERWLERCWSKLKFEEHCTRVWAHNPACAVLVMAAKK